MRSTSSLRPIFATFLLAVAAAPAAAIDPSYSGSWYSPPESGSGFNLEIFEDDRALLFWYTYDDAGDAVWLYSEGAIDGEEIAFDTYFAQGMRFSDLDAADKDNLYWGTVTMTFQDCDHATIRYESTLTGLDHSPVGSRTFDVERLVNIASLPCRSPLAGYWSGRWYDAWNERWVDLAGLIDHEGRMFMHSAEARLVIVGGTTANGPGEGHAQFEAHGLDERVVDTGTGSLVFAAKDFLRTVEDCDEYGCYPVQGLEATYRTVFDRQVSLASLAGEWAYSNRGIDYTMSVLADGTVAVSGSDGCEATGRFEQFDANFNSFYFAVQSDCEAGVLDEGFVVNVDVDPGDRAGLEFTLLKTDSTSVTGPRASWFVATRQTPAP